MTVDQMPKYPCPFCHKNEATQLCDFVVDYIWTSIKIPGKGMIGQTYETCDNPMCKECATRIFSGHEFCPTCIELYRYIQENYKPKHTRLNADIAFGKYEPQ